MFAQTKRVKYLGPSFADAERTVNTFDVLEVALAEAQVWIASGRAIATEAPIGRGVTPIEMKTCVRCGGAVAFVLHHCEFCGGARPDEPLTIDRDRA